MTWNAIMSLATCLLLAACGGSGGPVEDVISEDFSEDADDVTEADPGTDNGSDTATEMDPVTDPVPDADADPEADPEEEEIPTECTPDEAAACDDNATCVLEEGSPVCTCNDGWTGTGDVCEDIDECADGTDDCDSQATCANTEGSFTCTCNEGWTGTGDTCRDIDECADGTDNCDPNATCTNTAGSFTCTCNDGYTGPGTTCADIDECADGTDNCDLHATCANTDGSFTCTCDDGWAGPGTTCADIDECADGTDNCHLHATCTNTEGSFTCACNDGYTGSGTTCTDINECVLGLDDCDPHATCTNTGGSFTCTCNAGWIGTGRVCNIDVRYIADISSRPIRITIQGVGSYDIRAMGRLALEVFYTSTPGSGYHMERVPTGWQVHNLVMRNISAAAGSNITALVTWAGSVTPRNGTIRLDGLGAELLDLSLASMVPVSADTTVVGGRMAELVVSIANVGVSSYTPPAAISMPGNSTRIEIDGIWCSPGLLPEDIVESLPGTADPIYMYDIGNYRSPGWGDSGAYMDWMTQNTVYFDTFGDIERRSMSEVHVDGAGAEIDRYNCFEIFPYILYYFNPAKTYGSYYLVDIKIATEWCEAA